MDVLNDLLRIKIFREQKAERTLALAKQQLRMAERNVVDAKAMLKDFRIESARRESELYAELCARIVQIREIDSVQIDVQLMREREEELVEDVAKAEAIRDEAAEKERDAREQHALAVRMREKFSEITKAVEDERQFELSMLEELEIEEAAEVRFQLFLADDENSNSGARTQA